MYIQHALVIYYDDVTVYSPPRKFTSRPRAGICKRLRNPGIDSETSIPPVYVAWRPGTTSRFAVPSRQAGNRFLGSLKGLQIRALLTDRWVVSGLDCLFTGRGAPSRGEVWFGTPGKKMEKE